MQHMTRDQMEAHLMLQGWRPAMLSGNHGIYHDRIGFVYMDSSMTSKFYGAIRRQPAKPSNQDMAWIMLPHWVLHEFCVHLERNPYDDA